jgi:hypothetical protein
LGSISAELLDKVRVDFYTDPSQAAFKAMAEGFLTGPHFLQPAIDDRHF